jgi:ribosomal protein L20
MRIRSLWISRINSANFEVEAPVPEIYVGSGLAGAGIGALAGVAVNAIVAEDEVIYRAR